VVSVAALGAVVSGLQAAGVLVVAAGVLLVRGVRRGRGTVLALTIACCIASYTVVDKEGLEHASPLAYLELVTLIPGLAYAAGFVATRGRAPLRAALGTRAVIAGLASFAAYGLVLTALTLAPAAPVAAVRESSVLVATALAAWFLNEHVTRRRLAGAALVVGGIALLSL
jgi:drug/metabolite transporter (DMT)-like permease